MLPCFAEGEPVFWFPSNAMLSASKKLHILIFEFDVARSQLQSVPTQQDQQVLLLLVTSEIWAGTCHSWLWAQGAIR